MKKYLVELIGTFFLVFTIGNVVIPPGAGNLAPLAIGAVLMVMIYAGGYVSGGHYNPAVSLAVFIRGKLAAKELIIYWIAQILGGVAAALITLKVFDYAPTAGEEINIMRSFIAEVIGTFALAYVVLNVATSTKTAGNSNYGLAIGFTVTAMAYTLGPVSRGAFNPAVAVGASVFGVFEWSTIWLYVVGCLLGGALAGITYTYIIKPDED